jgi:hypothetical protein
MIVLAGCGVTAGSSLTVGWARHWRDALSHCPGRRFVASASMVHHNARLSFARSAGAAAMLAIWLSYNGAGVTCAAI